MALEPKFTTYVILSFFGIAGLLMGIFAKRIRDSEDNLYKNLYGKESEDYIEIRKKYFSREFIPVIRIVGICCFILSLIAIIKLH